MIATERSHALLDAVRRLTLPYRQVITLVLEDLTYAEIADVLGISVVNVGVRVPMPTVRSWQTPAML